MPSHDVFISHSSLDKPVADAVCHGLEAEGVRCWIAPRDVVPGMDWQQSLLDAIADAKATVLIFTGHANDSAHVRKEVTAAFEAGSVVVPFRLEAVEPQGALRWHLTGVHWLDAVTPPLEGNVKQLAETLKRLLQARADGAAPAAAAAEAAPQAAPLAPAVLAEPAPAIPPPPPAPPRPEAVAAPRAAAPVAPPPPPFRAPPAAPAPRSANSRAPWLFGGGLALILVVALLFGSLSRPKPSTTAGGGGAGPLAASGAGSPSSAAVSAPPAIPETPARAEAVFILRTPIENGRLFSGEADAVEGSTPLTTPGAATVTTHQLVNALANHVNEVTLVDAAGCDDHPSIPGARCLDPQEDAAQALSRAGVDAGAPVVFFCHGPTCAWSSTMATRAGAAGWRNVFWYRGGMSAWNEAEGPAMAPQPLAPPPP